MKKVVLKDGTEILNCLDSTTSNEVIFIRPTYEEAGAVLNSVTPENAAIIKVYSDNETLLTQGTDLILLPNYILSQESDGVIASFRTRVKTAIEKMQDEIVELQEAVIG